jgi:hypothetical protein
MYSRIGVDSKVRFLLVILGISSTLFIAYDYFQRRSIVHALMPEWVEIGVKAVYDEQTIICPGILNETKIIVEWEVVKVYRRSFEVRYSSAHGDRSTILNVDDPGHLNICVFEFEPEGEVYTVEEDEINFLDFDTLKVFRLTLEDEYSINTGIYECETGIMLQLESRWKGDFSEGETMGYIIELREINLDFNIF